MSDLLSDNDKKSMDEGMIYLTKLKLLNEPCITDDASVHTVETYHDNNSVNNINDEAMVTESNESFSSSTSISFLTSKKLKSSLQNERNDSCNKKEMNFMKSILGTVSTQQSSQTVSNDLKSQISADEMSQVYTARVILPEEIIHLGFNFYQISDHQQTSERSDKTAEVNVPSESEITETDNDTDDEIIESGNRFYDFTESVQSSIRDVKSTSKASESSPSLVLNSEYCIPRMNETSAMIITETSSFYLYKATDPFHTLYNTDEAQWSSFIPHNGKAWR